MLILGAFVLWVLGLLLAAIAIRRATEPETASPKPPPDPIAAIVAKWMHDWDRGRA